MASDNAVRLSAAIEVRRTAPFAGARTAGATVGSTAVPGPSRLPATIPSTTTTASTP
ncbi:MAG: hypothetical protein R2690_05715 [Acidimicrobiales bacterium]